MFILGSHNSWSFLKERDWWMLITRPFAKCQDIDIESQFNVGVRCFDLRLRFDEDSKLFLVCHGETIYNSFLEDDLDYLNVQASKIEGPLYIRVLLEDSGNRDDVVDSYFYDACLNLENKYKHIKFFGGWAARKRWRKIIYPFKHNPSVEENHASVKGKWYEKIPYIYSIIHNLQIVSNGTNKEILMIDFI